jgi:hypothetical protein
MHVEELANVCGAVGNRFKYQIGRNERYPLQSSASCRKNEIKRELFH